MTLSCVTSLCCSYVCVCKCNELSVFWRLQFACTNGNLCQTGLTSSHLTALASAIGQLYSMYNTAYKHMCECLYCRKPATKHSSSTCVVYVWCICGACVVYVWCMLFKCTCRQLRCLPSVHTGVCMSMPKYSVYHLPF